MKVQLMLLAAILLAAPISANERMTIQFASGAKISGVVSSVEETGIWLSSTDGRVWIAAGDLSSADRVRFGYAGQQERAHVAAAQQAEAARQAQERAYEAELQRRAEAAVAIARIRESERRAETAAAQQQEMARRAVEAQEQQAEEMRMFRLQLELEAARARGESIVIYDYGPRKKK